MHRKIGKASLGDLVNGKHCNIRNKEAQSKDLLGSIEYFLGNLLWQKERKGTFYTPESVEIMVEMLEPRRRVLTLVAEGGFWQVKSLQKHQTITKRKRQKISLNPHHLFTEREQPNYLATGKNESRGLKRSKWNNEGVF